MRYFIFYHLEKRKCGKRLKNDKIDYEWIARCLVHGGYFALRISTTQDDFVKDFIRMSDDSKNNLKHIKQKTIALLT